jgi:hypothetical protein
VTPNGSHVNAEPNAPLKCLLLASVRQGIKTSSGSVAMREFELWHLLEVEYLPHRDHENATFTSERLDPR